MNIVVFLMLFFRAEPMGDGNIFVKTAGEKVSLILGKESVTVFRRTGKEAYTAFIVKKNPFSVSKINM